MNTNTLTRQLLMICLLLPLFLRQQQSPPPAYPQVNPLTDAPEVREEWRRAYKDFKPGPQVAARIEEMKTREREAFDLWLDQLISLQELSIELERNAIHQHLLMCLALVAGDGEVPELVIVRVNTREIQKIFPTGRLPTDSLQPNQVYECEPGSSRRVRYLTLYAWDSKGERFAVFAREVEP